MKRIEHTGAFYFRLRIGKSGFIRLMILLWAGIFILTGIPSLYSQDLSEKQQQNLELKIKILLKKYELYSQLSTDGISLNDLYISEFNKLFSPSANTGLLNDIAPSGNGSFKTSEQYVTYIRQYYPQGLDVTLDWTNMKLINVQSVPEGIRAYVLVTKESAGIYNDQGIYRFKNELCFIISALPGEKDDFTNLQIEGIITKEKYAHLIVKGKAKGVYAGITLMGARNRIFDDQVYSDNLWNVKTKYSVSPGLELNWMITDGFGVASGFRLSTFETSFTLNNYNQQSGVALTDLDGDTYFPVLSISGLTDTRTIRCLDIPLIVKFKAGYGRLKFTFDAGILYSKVLKASYSLNGTTERAGYYPAYQVTLENISEYGFGSFSYNSDKTYAYEMPSAMFSAYGAIGIIGELNKFLFLTSRATVAQGLTRFKLTSDNPENYFTYTLTNPMNKTVLQSVGIEFGLVFKLF